MANLTGRQKLNRVKKILLENGFENPEGYVRKPNKKGFVLFVTYKGQTVYLSMSNSDINDTQILYRTAQNYKDFGGDSNNFLDFSNLQELPYMVKRIVKFKLQNNS